MNKETQQVVNSLVPKVGNMSREMAIAARLMKQYPAVFAIWAHDSGVKVKSLAYFETEGGAQYLNEQMMHGF